jgi:hypothetical protein
MIGPKKLDTIRQELRRAVPASGGDPPAWLEQRMAASKGHGPTASGESEIVHSLRRFLEAGKKWRKQRLIKSKR